MKIVWHGHACFEILNSISVVTDPHDGKSIGIHPPTASADLVLVSHHHFDHNKVNTVVEGDYKVVDTPGAFEYRDVKGRGIEAYHDELKGESRGKNIIFRFEMDGFVFCHMGDLGHVPSEEILKEIGEVDFLFIPVGGVYTVDGKKAAKITRLISPKVVIPMHFKVGNLSLPISTAEEFLNEMKDWSLFNVGKAIDFERGDVEEKTIWLFSLG